MDDKRFDRLENKVEKLDDKVGEVKIDLAELRSEVKNYTKEVKKHVESDEKIISEIIPFMITFKDFIQSDMPQIKEIVLAEQARRIIEKEKVITKTNWKLNLSILSGILGIIYTLYQMGIIKF